MLTALTLRNAPTPVCPFVQVRTSNILSFETKPFDASTHVLEDEKYTDPDSGHVRAPLPKWPAAVLSASFMCRPTSLPLSRSPSLTQVKTRLRDSNTVRWRQGAPAEEGGEPLMESNARHASRRVDLFLAERDKF